ncbi:flagellar basal body-associated protein FliL [Vogesella sp. XCS3]|uniref:flagellar basal body-associated FliL family protein n=1 Tax=Vogesella sp. XCS3 TaxID=2877939 RepID=UPI001D0AE738|nr:flagellar basal body-associated FliL family protein [Vogesella sp. XCS3]UDM17245.1 flagellar basal body-associated FliL family protein [Vogesella sp. XCS3]
MAEKEKKEDPKAAAAGAPAPAGGNKKLMIIVIVLLVLVLAAVGGLGAYLFLGQKHAAEAAAAGGAHGAAAAEQEAPKKKEKKEGPPIFEKVEPFVVNLSGGPTAPMLQLEMQAELLDEHAKTNFKAYMPKIRSAVILLLSSKTEEDVASAEGKVKLRAQIKRIMNESMDAAEEEPVDSVLFTSFIIQQQ